MSRGITKLSAVLIILVVLFAAVAAYGWLRPGVEVTKEVPVEVTLLDQAKKEGSLTVYGTPDVPDVENIVFPAFKKIYPWAQLTYYGLGPGESTTKVVSEYKAGHVTCDVYLAEPIAVHYIMANEGALQKYRSPMVDLMEYPQGLQDPKGYSMAAFALPVVFAYNTQLVTKDQAPKTYQDLADPKWKGKLIMDSPSTLSVSGPALVHLYAILGNATWTNLMKGIAANTILTESSSEAFQKMVMGEADIGVIFLNDYLYGKKQPQPPPIEVIWPTPAVEVTIYTAIPTNNPHPAMAKLFIEWLLSADGQRALADTGRPPAQPMVAASTLLAGVMPTGLDIVDAGSNNPDFNENPSKYADALKAIFG